MLPARTGRVAWRGPAASPLLSCLPHCAPRPRPSPATLPELPQVELCCQLLGHGLQCEEGSHDLSEEEGQEKAVHGHLQRQVDDVAVRQQEEQDGELDQEGEEEERGQLGHL